MLVAGAFTVVAWKTAPLPAWRTLMAYAVAPAAGVQSTVSEVPSYPARTRGAPPVESWKGAENGPVTVTPPALVIVATAKVTLDPGVSGLGNR